MTWTEAVFAGGPRDGEVVAVTEEGGWVRVVAAPRVLVCFGDDDENGGSGISSWLVPLRDGVLVWDERREQVPDDD